MTGLVVPLLASGSSTVTVNTTNVAAFYYYFLFVVSSYRFLNIRTCSYIFVILSSRNYTMQTYKIISVMHNFITKYARI
jgi:hypothetical protein